MKRTAWAATAALMVAALCGCTTTLAGKAIPANGTASVTRQQITTPTVTAPPVTVTQRQTTVQRPALTPCQQMYVDGYSFEYAYTAWANAGYPVSWDADHDGIPCEQSYGER